MKHNACYTFASHMPQRTSALRAVTTGAKSEVVEISGPPPPLKWAGGKRWQLPHLIDFWHQTHAVRLVEPFCGGLAVALGLMPDQAVLKDINPHLINFYKWLKRGLSISLGMANDEAKYYQARDLFNALLGGGNANTAEAATLFYYLNRTG